MDSAYMSITRQFETSGVAQAFGADEETSFNHGNIWDWVDCSCAREFRVLRLLLHPLGRRLFERVTHDV